MRAAVFHLGWGILRLTLLPAAAPAAVPGCTPESTDASAASPTEIRAPRCVRVLVSGGDESVRLRADAALHAVGQDREALAEVLAPEWMECAAPVEGGLRLGPRRMAETQVHFPDWSQAGGRLSRQVRGEWQPAMVLPGRLTLRRGPRGLQVINEVDVEEYVACVTAQEIPADFHAEAFRAQAVLCRSFVLYQMRCRSDEAYDVLASEGSQVYAGRVGGAAGLKARQAVEETAGLVCTCLRDGREDLFPTYYSSACGGCSQSAWTFNPSDRVEALSGNVACDFCRIAPEGVYRWGPVVLSEQAVRSAVQERYPRLTSLGPLRSIDILRRSPTGRPLEIALRDGRGEEWTMPAEHLRLAVGSRVMRSTDCVITLAGGQVRLEQGRGFGHGLGLCQWGMQGQALAGRSAPQILRYYFPGCSVTRVY